MIRKPRRDHIDDVLRQCIGRIVRRGRHEQIIARRFAVFLVEIPFAASRLVAIHQQPRLAPHVAIEKFHAERLAPFGPIIEFAVGRNEPCISANLDRDAEHRLPCLEHCLHAPLAAFGNNDPLGRMPLDRTRDFAGKAARIVRIIERDIIDCPPRLTQRFGMVPHRRKDERDLALVMADVRGLVGHFHHQDYGVRKVCAGKRGQVERQLVTKDRDQSRHPRPLPL